MAMVITPFELLGWAINRDTYVEAIVATNLSQWGWTEKLATKAINPETGQPDYPPVLIPGRGVQIDELGQVVGVPGVYDPDTGDEITPPQMIEGYHLNFRVYLQELKDALAAYIPTLTWVQADHGVPPAFMDANGMKWLDLFEADGVTPTIATRRRIWA